MKILERIKNLEDFIQNSVTDKMKNGQEITEYEAKNYKLTDEDKKIFGVLQQVIDGDNVPGLNLMDFLATPQAQILIPKVMIGQMRKAADPIYLASNFFKTIKLKSGTVVQFPSIGVMRAHDVAEGQEINYGVSLA